jgi:hypothetical protein
MAGSTNPEQEEAKRDVGTCGKPKFRTRVKPFITVAD